MSDPHQGIEGAVMKPFDAKETTPAEPYRPHEYADLVCIIIASGGAV